MQRILEAAGLELYHEQEEGEVGARPQIKYGFHSLRHSAVTMLRGVELNVWTAFVPVVNIALLIKALAESFKVMDQTD